MTRTTWPPGVPLPGPGTEAPPPPLFAGAWPPRRAGGGVPVQSHGDDADAGRAAAAVRLLSPERHPLHLRRDLPQYYVRDAVCDRGCVAVGPRHRGGGGAPRVLQRQLPPPPPPEAPVRNMILQMHTPSAHKSVLGSANPRMDSECASGCPWSPARATAPSPGRPTPGVVKQDKSSGGSVDTTKTRSGPQRVRMCSGERPIGAAKGKRSDTEALCHPPPPGGARHSWRRAQEILLQRTTGKSHVGDPAPMALCDTRVAGSGEHLPAWGLRDDRMPGTDQAVRGGRHGQKLHSGLPPPPRQGDARSSADACVS